MSGRCIHSYSSHCSALFPPPAALGGGGSNLFQKLATGSPHLESLLSPTFNIHQSPLYTALLIHQKTSKETFKHLGLEGKMGSPPLPSFPRILASLLDNTLRELSCDSDLLF